MIKVILLLTVFLTPLLPVTSYFGYEQIKVLFFLSLTTLAGFLWMGRGFKWTRISKLAGLFILILLITSLFGIAPKTSLLGAPPYFQGVILYAYLYLFFLMVSSTKIKLDTWAYILVGSSTLVGFIAIREWVFINIFHQQIPTYAGRVVSTFGQPNFYAGFILLTLPFFHFLMKKKSAKWWVMVGFLISILAIVLSQSRTAILILFLLLICWYIVRLAGLRKRLALFEIGMIAIFVIFVLAQTSQGILIEELKKPFSSQWLIDNSPEKRVFIWPIIGKLVMERLVLGYGLENIQASFSNFFTKIDFNTNSISFYYSLKDLVVDRAHNYILDLLLFSGILGLLGYLGLVGLMFKRAKGVFLTSLILYLIWTAFQNQSVVHLIYFWLILGFIDQQSSVI